MAMTKENVKKMYFETYDYITSGSEQWKSFLNTSSNIYRYNFASQLMIYAQRPDATACASFKVWTDFMNRKIKYGSKGIALYDEVRGEQTYVFDISDTKPLDNSRPMHRWALESFHQKPVLERLSSIMGMSLNYSDGFSENILKITRKYAEEQYRELEEDYRREQQTLGKTDDEAEKERNMQISFLSATIGYSVLKRCGMSQSLLDKIFNFDDVLHINKEQLFALADLSSNVTDQVLQETKNAIKEYDKAHFNIEYADLEAFISNNMGELLSYDTKISLSDDGEMDAICINIQEKNHDFALLLKKDGIFVVRLNSPQGIFYTDHRKIFDENAVLSKNVDLIPLKQASADIKYEILIHTSRYKDCIHKLKYELEESVRRHTEGGAKRTLISAFMPLRLCRIGTNRRFSAD